MLQPQHVHHYGRGDLYELAAAHCFHIAENQPFLDGNEGMAWHSDDEKSLGRNTAIASVSFGAERNFRFKHKRLPHTVSAILEHGSLLVMKDATQTHWLHSVPKSKRIQSPRINLTFRTIVRPG